MVEGCAYFLWEVIPATENGLTTTSQNGNPTNYNAPTTLGTELGVDPRFRIYGGVPVVSTQSIPTASSSRSFDDDSRFGCFYFTPNRLLTGSVYT